MEIKAQRPKKLWKQRNRSPKTGMSMNRSHTGKKTISVRKKVEWGWKIGKTAACGAGKRTNEKAKYA